jgi:hypothetical protein
MTARRRRKSGSGPSATALIAWVGGARTGIGVPTIAPLPVLTSGPTGRTVGSRAIFLGRACGLAAGTLLACGSVLAGATHLGDGSDAQNSVPLLDPSPTAPNATADVPASAYRAEPSAEPAPIAPDVVSVQAVGAPGPALHPQLGQVRRNAPVALDMPAEQPVRNPGAVDPPRSSPPPVADPAPQKPVAPVNPVLDPAARGVGRVGPVGEVLAPNEPSPPTNPRQVRAKGSGAKPTESPHDERNSSSRDQRSGGKRSDPPREGLLRQ